MSLDFDLIIRYGPFILQGFVLTVILSALGFVGSTIMGTVTALAANSERLALRLIAISYVELIRNLPLLLLVFFLYYVLPFWGVRLPAWIVGVIAISLYSGAYFSEMIRAAINSIPRGQMESARAIGMSKMQAMRKIIFPQMLGFLIPPATSQSISLVKETAILSVITVPEMTHNAHEVTGITFSPFEMFLLIALLYWGLTATVSHIGGHIEKRVAARQGAGRRPVAAPAAAEPAALVDTGGAR